ncbi:12370_t:CDS:1, partial [Acaulospora colombiana]
MIHKKGFSQQFWPMASRPVKRCQCWTLPPVRVRVESAPVRFPLRSVWPLDNPLCPVTAFWNERYANVLPEGHP